MKIALKTCGLVAAVAVVAFVAGPARAATLRLDDAQLDGITAGAILQVQAIAAAYSTGNIAVTYAQTGTNANPLIAFGDGVAVAIGSNGAVTYVFVDPSGGTITRTMYLTFNDGLLSASVGVGFTLALPTHP